MQQHGEPEQRGGLDGDFDVDRGWDGRRHGERRDGREHVERIRVVQHGHPAHHEQ